MEHVTYQINARDEILSVGDDWVTFADANEAAHLNDGVVGRSLFDFVSDPTTEHVYRRLLARVRTGRTLSFAFRCDSPALRRFMQMTMAPGGGGAVAFDSVTLRIETRVRPLPALVSARSYEPGLQMCSWCKRIKVFESWEEAEIAVDRLELFAVSPAPLISHTMCLACLKQFDEFDADSPT